MVHPSWHDYPSLLEDLDTSKNRNLTFRGKPVKATDLAVGTNKKLDWRCSACEHQWSATGNDRVAGKGCPACANRVVHSDGRNSMANTHPELAKEYQGDATTVIAGTTKSLPWRCSACEHQWSATGNNRVAGKGCPACANQAVHSDGRNSMANTHPELAKEYQGTPPRSSQGPTRGSHGGAQPASTSGRQQGAIEWRVKAAQPARTRQSTPTAGTRWPTRTRGWPRSTRGTPPRSSQGQTRVSHGGAQPASTSGRQQGAVEWMVKAAQRARIE